MIVAKHPGKACHAKHRAAHHPYRNLSQQYRECPLAQARSHRILRCAEPRNSTLNYVQQLLLDRRKRRSASLRRRDASRLDDSSSLVGARLRARAFPAMVPRCNRAAIALQSRCNSHRAGWLQQHRRASSRCCEWPLIQRSVVLNDVAIRLVDPSAAARDLGSASMGTPTRESAAQLTDHIARIGSNPVNAPRAQARSYVFATRLSRALPPAAPAHTPAHRVRRWPESASRAARCECRVRG